MSEFQMHKSESVVRRYEFSVTRQIGNEDALIFTNQRVVRRFVVGDTFVQNDILLSDVNKIDTSYQTSRYPLPLKTDPKKILLIVIAAIIFFAALVVLFAWNMTVGGVLIGVALVIFLLSFLIKKKQEYMMRTALKIKVYERQCNACVIEIEKEYSGKSFALEIANEIGSVLLRARAGEVGKTAPEEEKEETPPEAAQGE